MLARIKDYLNFPCYDPASQLLPFSELAIHPDGPLLAGICDDTRLEFFNQKSEVLAEYDLEEFGYFGYLAFSPDGKLLAAYQIDVVSLFSVTDGSLFGFARTQRYANGLFTRWTDPGYRIRQNIIFIPNCRRFLMSISSRPNGADHICSFLPDGRLIATTGRDGVI